MTEIGHYAVEQDEGRTVAPRGCVRSFRRYYFDKYLLIVLIFSALFAVGEILYGGSVRAGVFYLLAALACILAAKHKLVFFGGLCGIVSFRSAIRFLGTQEILPLLVALAGALSVYLLLRLAPQDYHVDMPERYTWKELVADVIAFHIIVAIFILLRWRSIPTLS